MAIEKYIKALGKGLLKNHVQNGNLHPAQLSQRPGVSSGGAESRCGEKYFTGTASHVEGIGLDEIAVEANEDIIWPTTLHRRPLPFCPAAALQIPNGR